MMQRLFEKDKEVFKCEHCYTNSRRDEDVDLHDVRSLFLTSLEETECSQCVFSTRQ